MYTRTMTTITMLCAMLAISGCDAEDEFGRDDEEDEDKSLSASWTNCASQGETCHINSGSRVLVRYGIEKDGVPYYRYGGVNGVTDFPCNNDPFGDPYPGEQAKNCAFSVDHAGVFLGADNEWQHCAEQTGVCDLGADARWVRYGYGDKWIEVIRSGLASCTNDGIGWDPIKKEKGKYCEMGALAYPGEIKNFDAVPGNDGDWNHCATQNETCMLDGNVGVAGALVAYGAGRDYIDVMTSAPSLECNDDRFGYDPKRGSKKDCYYRPLPSNAHTTGRWTERISHGSDEGGSLMFSVEHGLEMTQGTASSTTWSVEISRSVSAGVQLPAGPNSNTTTSITAGWERTSEISQATTRSVLETAEVTCSAPPEGGTVKLYQFVTDTEANCFDTGKCLATTHLLMTQCIYNPPADYAGPACFPGQCDPSDPLCTKCITG